MGGDELEEGAGLLGPDLDPAAAPADRPHEASVRQSLAERGVRPHVEHEAHDAPTREPEREQV